MVIIKEDYQSGSSQKIVQKIITVVNKKVKIGTSSTVSVSIRGC